MASDEKLNINDGWMEFDLAGNSRYAAAAWKDTSYLRIGAS